MSGLNVYRDNLEYQMGENGNFTEPAVYDPSGIDESIIFGIFDDVSFQDSGSDVTGSKKKNTKAVFMVTYKPANFDIYDNKRLYFSDRGKSYLIEYMETDDEGIQKLWLS
jgi:hypothetical protein